MISLTLGPSTQNFNKNDDYLLKEYIDTLKMIVNLFNIEHLDISDATQMDITCVLLEILKEASNLSSLKIAPRILKSLLDNNDLHKYLNKIIRKLTISG